MRTLNKKAQAALEAFFSGNSNEPVSRPIAFLLKLQPLISLCFGTASIILWKKGFDYVPYIAAFVIISLMIISYRIYQSRIKKKNQGLSIRIFDLTLQYFISNMITFIIPFYFDSTTVPSFNMAFDFLLLLLLVIVSWNSIYYRWLDSNPAASGIFFSITFFATLNFIFPVIFGMRNVWSMLASGIISSASACVYLLIHSKYSEIKLNPVKIISAAIVSLTILVSARTFIPPAPLKIKTASACENVKDFTPYKPFEILTADEGEKIFFFSRIFAPLGLREKIDHVWYFEGRKLFTVNLSEISGGAREGFATWSYHHLTEGSGTYRVDVWTSGGQLLGRYKFQIKINQTKASNSFKQRQI